MRDKDGFRKYLTIGPAFDVSTSDAGVGEDYAVHTESVNAEAPARMLKLVVAKTGLPPCCARLRGDVVLGELQDRPGTCR